MRTLDILSSGGLCVSGYNEGVDRNLMTSSVYPPQTLQLQRPPRRPTMLRPPTCPILIQLRIIKVHCRRDGSVALITSVARITSITALAPRLEQHHLNRANRWYKPFANARRFQEIVGQDTLVSVHVLLDGKNAILQRADPILSILQHVYHDMGRPPPTDSGAHTRPRWQFAQCSAPNGVAAWPVAERMGVSRLKPTFNRDIDSYAR